MMLYKCVCASGSIFVIVVLPAGYTASLYFPLSSHFGSTPASVGVIYPHLSVCECVCERVCVCNPSIPPRMWLMVSDARGIILIMTEQHNTSILQMSSPTGVCVWMCVCVSCSKKEKLEEERMEIVGFRGTEGWIDSKGREMGWCREKRMACCYKGRLKERNRITWVIWRRISK